MSEAMSLSDAFDHLSVLSSQVWELHYALYDQHQLFAGKKTAQAAALLREALHELDGVLWPKRGPAGPVESAARRAGEETHGTD